MSTSASWFAFGSCVALWTLRRRSRKFRCRDVVFNGPQACSCARCWNASCNRAACSLVTKYYFSGLTQMDEPEKFLSPADASSAHDAILVRLCHGGKLSQDIIDVLERDDIFKFGVNILEDARPCLQSCGVIVRGALTSGGFRRCCKLQCRDESASIAAASAIDAVDVSYKKAKRVAMSNWDAEHLSANQVAYAASDAILGLVAARGIVTKVAAEDLLISVKGARIS